MKGSFTILLVALCARLFSQSFALDHGFGFSGTVSPQFGSNTGGMLWSVADSAGNVYFAAVKDSPSSQPNICLGKLNPAGNLLWQTFPHVGVREASLAQIAIQPDGKVVAVGGVEAVLSTNSVLVLRYNADGSPDSTFGTNGVSITTLGRAWYATALALQHDGKILVACHGDSAGSTTILRLNANGSSDATFSGTGYKTINQLQTWVIVNKIIAAADGSILLGGYVIWTPTNTNGLWVYNYSVAKLTPAGAYDAAFGHGNGAILGIPVTTETVYQDEGLDLQVDSTGYIYQSGYTFVSNTPWTNGMLGIQKYKPNGDMDSTFGTAHTGVAMIGPRLTGGKIGLLHDGNILLAGNKVNSSGSSPVLYRYFADGTLDSTFGSTHTGTFTYGYSSFASATQNIFVQSDGKVLVTNAGSVSRFGYSTTGILQISDMELALYPNPTTGKVYIHRADQTGMVSYQVIDAVGHVVCDGRIASTDGAIDISMLPAGMYIVRLTQAQSVYVGRVIKE